MSSSHHLLLIDYVDSVPSEAEIYSETRRSDIANKGDVFITSMGCMYLAARAYIRHWREFRKPATLTQKGLSVFKGRVNSELLAYATDLAVYGVKPMAKYPAVRSPQKPYSSLVGNPIRTCDDMWGDLVKGGGIMLFSKRCEHLVGPLMESRLAFVTQKDATKEKGVKVRYISDPRVGINERIDPSTHPRVRGPKHANVIRIILYGRRRYPTIPVFFMQNRL